MPVLFMQLHVSKEQTVVKDCSWRGTNLRPVCLLTGYATAHNLLQLSTLELSTLLNEYNGRTQEFKFRAICCMICMLFGGTGLYLNINSRLKVEVLVGDG
eukprot:jgi/Botrbrau1/23037/Bobra.136_1s0026.1